MSRRGSQAANIHRTAAVAHQPRTSDHIVIREATVMSSVVWRAWLHARWRGHKHATRSIWGVTWLMLLIVTIHQGCKSVVSLFPLTSATFSAISLISTSAPSTSAPYKATISVLYFRPNSARTFRVKGLNNHDNHD